MQIGDGHANAIKIASGHKTRSTSTTEKLVHLNSPEFASRVIRSQLLLHDAQRCF
jgi:hypothetical protein